MQKNQKEWDGVIYIRLTKKQQEYIKNLKKTNESFEVAKHIKELIDLGIDFSRVSSYETLIQLADRKLIEFFELHKQARLAKTELELHKEAEDEAKIKAELYKMMQEWHNSQGTYQDIIELREKYKNNPFVQKHIKSLKVA